MNPKCQFSRVIALSILGLLFHGFVLAQTTVVVSPGTSNILRGSSFSISIQVANVANLQGSHVSLSFNNSIVSYTGATAGNLFPSGSFFQSSPAPGPAVSSITVDQAMLGAGTVTGSGILFTASFTALVTGTSVATITADLRDNNNNSIPATITSGQINVENPVPSTTSINPTSKTTDDVAFILTVNGTNFFPDSKVRFNGSDRTTTYVNGTQLTAQILTSDLSTTGNFTVTVFNPAPGGGTSNAQTFLVQPGAIHHFRVDGFTSPQTAGTPFSITLTTEDAHNNTVTGFVGTANLSTTAGTISPTTSGAFTSGVRTENVTVTLAGSGATISVDDGIGHTGTSASFTVNPGSVDHFVISSIGSPQTAGAPFTISITAKDANNNTATGFVSTVNLSTTAGSISPLVSGSFVAGVRTENVTVTQSGTGKTISVNDGAGHPGTSNAFDVVPGTLDHFTFSTIPTPQTAGSPFSITITAKDANENTVTGFIATVNLSTTAGTISPTMTGAFVGGVRSENISVTQTGSGRTVSANDGSGHVGTSNPFTVDPATVASFAVEASGGGPIGNQTAGTPFSIRVTALDAFGNSATGFVGTVDITSTGSLSAGGGTTATFLAGVLSSHSTTISNTGSFTITATRTGGAEVGTSNSFAVGAGALHHFAISSVAGPQTAGIAFAITITAQDANNNTVPSFIGTVNLSTTAGSVTPTFSGAFSGGVRTENVTVTQSGTAKTISVNDGSGHTGVSNAFDVNPGTVDHFVFGAISGPQTAGAPFSTTMTAQDVYGNTVTGFSGTVNLSTTAGTISPTVSGAFVGGVRTENVSVTQAGAGKSISANDGLGHSGTSNSFTVNPASLSNFLVESSAGGPIGAQSAGSPFNIRVTARDAFGNTATDFVGTVDITSTGSLTAGGGTTSSFLAGVLASHIITISHTGSFTITATKTGGAESGTSNAFTVSAGALHHFAVAAIPSPQIAGAPFNITITAQDANNNTVILFAGTVGLTTTAGTITPSPSGTFASGVRTEAVTVTQSGLARTITANDGAGHTGTSNTFDVNPGALHHFTTSSVTSPQVAGVPFNITITAQDFNNNTVASFVSTVGLTTTAGSITPPNSGPFGAGIRVEAVAVSQAGTSKTISVDDGAGHTGTSNSFDVNPGPLHHFSIGTILTPQVAGTPFDITITAKDQFENTVTSFTSTVNLFTTAGTISPLTSGTFSAGVRSQSVTVTQAGTGKDITVNDGFAHTGGSNTFDVLAGTLHHFAIATISSPQSAGVSFNITITAQDLNSNTVSGFSGSVNLATTAGSISPTVSGSFTSGARTEAVTVTLAGGNKTISVDDGLGHTGVSNQFDVNVGGLHHFAVSAISSPQVAGTPFSITITAQDLNNNTVPSFTGTVPLSTTAGTIAPVTTGAFVAGVKTLNVTVTRSGAGKIISVDDGAGHAGTSNTFTVDPGALDHFSFATIAGMQAGTPSNITITAQDANNNTVTLFTATVNLTTTAGTISPTVTGAFVGGVRTEAVSVTQSGTGKTITANDGSGHAGTSNTFTVNSGALINFLVEIAGGGPIPTQIVGAPFALQITARDAWSNTVTAFIGTVDITSTGALSAGSGTTGAFTAGVLASHSVTISNTGTFTITATKTGGVEAGTTNSFSVFNANYTITASAGANGTISPTGVVTVPYNTDKTFLMTPTLGYHVGGLIVDGTPVNPANSYTFTAVNADHTISATFAQDCYTVSGPGVINIDATGDGTTDIKLDFAVVPNGGGSVCIAVYFAPPSGAPAPPAGSIPYYFIMTTSMPAHSFRATVKGDMNGTAGYGATSHVMYYNTVTSSWVMEASTFTAVDPVFSSHPSYTFTTDHFTYYTFVNTAAAPSNMFVSASSTAAAGTMYPNDSWGTTAYEPDWLWSGAQPVSFWLVPEVGAQFGKSDLTIQWDGSMMSFASVDFGATGSPNGLYGTGQAYPHAQSYDQGFGPHTLTIHAQRTDNNNFTIAANDYLAQINFILLKPGHSAVAVIGSDFQKFAPTTAVDVISAQGEVKGYLGDFARVGNQNLGDGVIDFQDLAPWSLSYWSGTSGFTLANYKVKYDIGPTADRYVFSLPQTDTKIDFEDLVIFSISYGQSASHELPKLAVGDSAFIELGAPVAHGAETWIPLLISGNIIDLRALSIEVTGHFSAFLGAENGELLKAYTTPIALMKKSVEGIVSVDLAVLGLNAHGIRGEGDVVWLRFAGSPRVHLQNVEGRTSRNTIVSLLKRKGAGDSQPTTYELLQNYPNPFNPSTTINYVLPDQAQVTIEVYNVLGERVATLVSEVKLAGFHQTVWNGENENDRKVGSGMYFYRLSATNGAGKTNAIVKKMLLVK